MPRQEIDPLFPFIQVDRGVGPKAAQLAGHLSVSYQHARGSLEIFWETLADRRRLANREELVLPLAEVEVLLHLAFGRPVLPEIMVALGFLEPRETAGFRIRGMSRYINSEKARILKKGVGKGREKTEPEPGQHPGATPVPPHPDPTPTPGNTPVPPRRGKRGEERVESLKEEEGAAVIAWWVWAQEKRRERFPHAIEDHRRAGAEDWYQKVLGVPGVTDERLRDGWLFYLGDPYGRSREPVCAFQAFQSDGVWRRCVEGAAAKAFDEPPKAPCAVPGCRRSAEAATWGEHPLCLQHHGTWSNSQHLPHEPRPETEAEFQAFLTSLQPTP
jgi:hypothetical protein